MLGFAMHLGAALYEAMVVAPMWSASPPKSITSWAMLANRPNSAALFHPLAGVIVVAMLLAWVSGVTVRGWRRWWLTLALAASAALVAVTFLMVLPCERLLFGSVALGDGDAPTLIALTGEWIRAAALRFAVLLVGAWATWRAQLAISAATANASASRGAALPEYSLGRAAAKTRHGREFSLGEPRERDIVLGEEAANPRDRWRGTLPRGRRTAKK